jgi:SAM-dependent methyltransferase
VDTSTSLSSPTTPAMPLPLTGERTLPGIADERYWFERHVVAYTLAVEAVERFTADQTGIAVLDAGCGEGYGLAMLADAGATRVIGADLDELTVAHAQRTYADRDARIEVVAAELMSLPLGDATIDLTVSFQVIEHLHDIPGYLRSLRRVTRPGGTVMIATPNRLTFTPDSDVPVNPFHTKEFTAAELTAELEARGLEVDEVIGVHHGHELTAIERERGATMGELQSASEPSQWPTWLREVVHAVTPGSFEVRRDDLDASLDLIAICRVPEAAPVRERR